MKGHPPENNLFDLLFLWTLSEPMRNSFDPFHYIIRMTFCISTSEDRAANECIERTNRINVVITFEGGASLGKVTKPLFLLQILGRISDVIPRKRAQCATQPYMIGRSSLRAFTLHIYIIQLLSERMGMGMRAGGGLTGTCTRGAADNYGSEPLEKFCQR